MTTATAILTGLLLTISGWAGLLLLAHTQLWRRYDRLVVLNRRQASRIRWYRAEATELAGAYARLHRRAVAAAILTPDDPTPLPWRPVGEAELVDEIEQWLRGEGPQ